jgi:predicted RNA polymerase sigma factor
MTGSPVVAINRAIAVAETRGPAVRRFLQQRRLELRVRPGNGLASA